jgi:hypothetical protein
VLALQPGEQLLADLAAQVPGLGRALSALTRARSVMVRSLASTTCSTAVWRFHVGDGPEPDRRALLDALHRGHLPGTARWIALGMTS